LTVFYFNRFGTWINETEESINTLITRIWVRHYGHRFDDFDKYLPTLTSKLKEDFLGLSWNEMFDILQFIPNNYKRSGYEGGYDNQTNKQFISFAIDI